MFLKKLVWMGAFVLPFMACSLQQNSNHEPEIPAPTRSTPSETAPVQPSPLPFDLYGTKIIDMTYCTMDGEAQKMDLYLPGEGGPWPVLVYVHGGGWTAGDKANTMGIGGEQIQGYALASINYRLYPAVRFPKMIEDVKCAIRSLRAHATQLNLDPNRIAAMGASAGGHLVSLLGTSDQTTGWDVGEYLDQSSRVQAVVALAPATDFSQEFLDPDNQLELLNLFGPENLLTASPVTYVSPDDPPFLLVHGDQDTLLPVQQSQSLHAKLQEAGVPAQLVIVENADHSLTAADGSAVPTIEQIHLIIFEFLAAHLR
jgi:acetyl esterase/lipase